MRESVYIYFMIRITAVFVAVVIFSNCDTAFAQTKEIKLADLIEPVVDVRLKGNKQLSGCNIISAVDGKEPETWKSFKVQLKDSKRTSKILAKNVVEIFLDGQPMDVAYDRKSRGVSISEEKKKERLEWEREVNRKLASRRDRLWKPLTAAKHEEFMVKHRLFIKKTKQKMSHLQFRYVEREYFMFLTNLSSQEVDGLLEKLDLMYSELCKAFGIPPTHNIWCGKCVVVAFRDQSDFLKFESQIMNVDATGAQGICHSFGDGKVIFAGYQGDNGFPNVLVHETSHGFVHRYMSSAGVPSWLNEGMADWISHQIVRNNRIPTRQKIAAMLVRKRGTLGDLLTKKQNISADEYGMSSAIVDLLIQIDRGRGKFREFFEAIKQGTDAEQALNESFGFNYAELTVRYARSIGMSSIR